MAKRLTQPVFIEELPAPLREATIDKLVAEESTRKVSAYLAKHGFQLSHSALARYKRERLNPQVERAQQVIELQRHTQQKILQTESVADVTKALLVADPLLSRIAKKYERYDKLTDEAVQAKDYTGFAAIDRSETQAIRLHAELTGRLVDKGPTMNVQMVFAGNPVETALKQESIDNGDVIDIRAVTR